MSAAQQRLRLRFRKGERVRHISHLDVLRYWERAIRRAGLPLLYSEGFTPHPKIAFAAPLPLGFTAEGEVMEVTLEERVPVESFAARLHEQTAPEMDFTDVREVGLGLPAPQTLTRWADYRVELDGVSEPAAAAAVDRFLALEELPWREVREGKKDREYDLRGAVSMLRVASSEPDGVALEARVRVDQELTVRPEQLLAALLPGASSRLIIRTAIILDEPSVARRAWRAVGQYQ